MPKKFHGVLHYSAAEIAEMGSGTGPGSGVVPVGGVIMWSGLLSAIPTGWQLCDGTNSTPDLRGKFVKGAAVGANPGATGGSSTYSHSGTAVADHAALSHSGGAVTRATSGVTVADHAAHTHAYGTIAVASHTGQNTGQASAGSTARGTTASTLTIATHTHSIPTLTHTVSGSTDNPSATLTHTVNEPNDGAGHDHAFTQPGDHAALSHSVTQPSDHTGVEPPFYAIAFIRRMS